MGRRRCNDCGTPMIYRPNHLTGEDELVCPNCGDSENEKKCQVKDCDAPATKKITIEKCSLHITVCLCDDCLQKYFGRRNEIKRAVL